MKTITRYKEISIRLNKSKKRLEWVGKVGSIKKQFSGKAIIYVKNKLFFLAKVDYKVFIKLLNVLYTGITYGYFIEINFVGLSSRFLKVKNYLLLKLGFSHYIKYLIPKNIHMFGYKRKLIIYGMEIVEINKLAKQLRLFKKPTVYKGKGIQIVGDILRTKIGKQR